MRMRCVGEENTRTARGVGWKRRGNFPERINQITEGKIEKLQQRNISTIKDDLQL